MRLLVVALFLFSACGGEEAVVQNDVPDVPDEPKTSVPDPYCGDGVCDEHMGENNWWCIDCGYDWLTGGPKDGGYCGDGVCFGKENMKNCCTDCCPIPIPPWNGKYDPGWIDPINVVGLKYLMK